MSDVGDGVLAKRRVVPEDVIALLLGRCLWIKMEVFCVDYVSFVGGDVVVVGSEVECFV